MRNADVSRYGARCPIVSCPNGDNLASYVPEVPGLGNVGSFTAACVNGHE